MVNGAEGERDGEVLDAEKERGIAGLSSPPALLFEPNGHGQGGEKERRAGLFPTHPQRRSVGGRRVVLLRLSAAQTQTVDVVVTSTRPSCAWSHGGR